MSKFKIDIKWVDKLLDGEIKKRLNEWIIELYSDVIKKSPVDTWEYLKWNKTEKATKQWTKFIAKVYNDSENSVEVEYGWRKSPVNWHKNRKSWWPIIYTWVWARVITRVFDNQENIKKIQDIFNK